MHAAVYWQQGGPEVFTDAQVPEPICHAKGIVMRVEAISVEGGDLLDRSGNLGPMAQAPYIAGRQAAGTIVQIGADVTGFSVGQRAVAARPNGSYAEFFAAPARTIWAIPAGLDVTLAAAVPVAFGSAYDALTHVAGLQPGESVLVQGGAGGVGIAAIQIARRQGAAIIMATGSSDDRLARLRPLGMDQAINRLTTDVVAEAMRLTNGKGVDVVLDTIGGPALQQSVACLAQGGRVIMLGQASREPATVDIANLIPRSGAILGFKLDIAGARLHETVQMLLEACRRGEYQVVIDRSFPLSHIAAAHRHSESRAGFGRVIVIP